jgi:hypothetical protein
MFAAFQSFVDYYADLIDGRRVVLAGLLSLPFLLALLVVSARAAWVDRDDGPWTNEVTPPERTKGKAGHAAPEPSVWQLHPRTIRFLDDHGWTIFLVLFFSCALALAKQFV